MAREHRGQCVLSAALMLLPVRIAVTESDRGPESVRQGQQGQENLPLKPGCRPVHKPI